MSQPRLSWDIGTAYDLFVSIDVLHHPGPFGLRGAWAAGVRARLSPQERETLELALELLLHTPYHWLYNLPAPKDGATAVYELGRMPAAQRLPALLLTPDVPQAATALLLEVIARGAWDQAQFDALRGVLESWGKGHKITRDTAVRMLDTWSRPAEFGERFLQALRSYHEVFFAEEEQRIRPALEAALAHAQELAGRLALPDLLEELSQGLRFVELPEAEELVLAPCYWCTPFLYFGSAGEGRQVWLFGAKPPDASLVPGEAVPDALVQTLKALSDPTRLRILRYLSEEPLMASELSRRLRLRIPTVTHHLQRLRLAGLVQLTVGDIDGQEKDLYALRFDAAESAFEVLRGYLGQA